MPIQYTLEMENVGIDEVRVRVITDAETAVEFVEDVPRVGDRAAIYHNGATVTFRLRRGGLTTAPMTVLATRKAFNTAARFVFETGA